MPSKLRDAARPFYLDLHADLSTSVSRIVAAFDAFGYLIMIASRWRFDAVTGPSLVDDAVFGFRAAAVAAFGENEFTQPNFLNVAQVCIGLFVQSFVFSHPPALKSISNNSLFYPAK